MADNDLLHAPKSSAYTAPESGYVYLSISDSMPGFVQLDTTVDDPTDLKWSLRTMSGVTHFRNVFTSRTSDTQKLVARFRKALQSDQIPNHTDLFKIPIRFAKQILEDEAKAFPPTPLPEPAQAHVIAPLPSTSPETIQPRAAISSPARKASYRPYILSGLVASAVAVSLAFLPVHHHATPTMATLAKAEQPLLIQKAPAPRIATPQFRVRVDLAQR
jgi:hypothetical protein